MKLWYQQLLSLNDTMDRFCNLLRSANQSVFNGNCIAAGTCVSDTFAYAPAVYSITNNDFVRSTVRSFYLRHGGDDLCPAASEDEEALRLQNVDEQRECASTQINVVNRALSELRQVAHTMARAALYTFNVVTSLFRTVLSSASSTAMGDLMFWFDKLVNELRKIMLELAQMIFRLTFNLSTFGEIIRDALKEICKWLTWILDKFALLWCKIVDPVLEEILKALTAIMNEVENAINSIPFVSGFKFGVLRTVIEVIEGLRQKMADWVCSGVGFNCDWLDIEPDDIDTGALPVATRCWADFVPFAGIASSLSCSRADTCATDALSGEVVMCDACPVQDGVTFRDYGCNLLTKQCSCKTQPRTTTYCSSSAECSLDATCLLTDDPFATAAWGVDLCSSCSTEAMCVFDGTETVGKCACPFTPPKTEICDEGAIGDTVFIRPTSLSVCYYTFSAGVQNGATVRVSPDALAVVPCSMVDPTAVVCVYMGGRPAVVAFRLINQVSAGRRLLSTPILDFLRGEGNPANQELADSIMMFSDWNRTAEPCRSLVIGHRQQVALGPVDTYVLRHCVFWRMVGNMTRDIPDTLFLSVEDAFDAISNDPSVMIKAVHSLGDTVRAVLSLWPAAKNFVAHVAPLIDGRNDSWLVLAHQAMEDSVTPKHPEANWDAFHEIVVGGGRRKLMQAPRIEDVTGVDIAYHRVFKSKEYVETMYRTVGLSALNESAIGGLVTNAGLFSVSGFDDFLSSQQPEQDPSFPTADYWIDDDGDGQLDWNTCPVAAIVIDEVKDGIALVARVYGDGLHRVEPDQLLNVSAAMPSFVKGGISSEPPMAPTVDSFGTLAVESAAGLLESLAGLTGGDVAAMLRCSDDASAFSLCNFVRDYFTCDQEAVHLCTKRDHSIYLAIVICGVMYLLCAYAMSALGLGSFTFALWLTFPGFIAWYTYGYLLACVPMVPTCLFEDVMLPVYFFIPRNLHVSAALQRVPDCWDNNLIAPSDCFRSCASDPLFNYQSLSATYAQLLCEVYGLDCYQVGQGAIPSWMEWLIDPGMFNTDLYNKYLAQWNYYSQSPPSEDDLIAQRFCAFTGFVFAAPYVMVGVVGLLVVSAVPVLLFRLLALGLQVLIQMIFYSHMSLAGDI